MRNDRLIIATGRRSAQGVHKGQSLLNRLCLQQSASGWRTSTGLYSSIERFFNRLLPLCKARLNNAQFYFPVRLTSLTENRSCRVRMFAEEEFWIRTLDNHFIHYRFPDSVSRRCGRGSPHQSLYTKPREETERKRCDWRNLYAGVNSTSDYWAFHRDSFFSTYYYTINVVGTNDENSGALRFIPSIAKTWIRGTIREYNKRRECFYAGFLWVRWLRPCHKENNAWWFRSNIWVV